MGTPKGLLRRSEKYWLEEQLAGFFSVGGTRTIVVLGFYANEYLEKIPSLSSIKTVVNETPEKGPFSSLQTGVRELLGWSPFPGAFVLPVDVPCPQKKVWQSLAEKSGGFSACLPVWRNQGGHPVLLGTSFLKPLLQCSPDDRLDARLKQLPSSQVARIAVEDETITRNINTVADWESFRVGYADV